MTDHSRMCHDLDCRAHGKYLRRIYRLQVALITQRRANRERLARAWSAWFWLALTDKLEDGTPLLAYVLETNPELRVRLEQALERGTT